MYIIQQIKTYFLHTFRYKKKKVQINNLCNTISCFGKIYIYAVKENPFL